MDKTLLCAAKEMFIKKAIGKGYKGLTINVASTQAKSLL